MEISKGNDKKKQRKKDRKVENRWRLAKLIRDSKERSSKKKKILATKQNVVYIVRSNLIRRGLLRKTKHEDLW